MENDWHCRRHVSYNDIGIGGTIASTSSINFGNSQRKRDMTVGVNAARTGAQMLVLRRRLRSGSIPTATGYCIPFAASAISYIVLASQLRSTVDPLSWAQPEAGSRAPPEGL